MQLLHGVQDLPRGMTGLAGKREPHAVLRPRRLGRRLIRYYR
jgi:hypothetical protein